MARAKADTPPFRMIIERGPRLVPATSAEAERLDTWRVGSEVNVQFMRNGSRVMERKWWAVLGLVVDQCNVPWKTKDQASEAIKLALGIVNLTKTVGGSWMQYPKSLTELSDPELDEAVRDMMDLITKMTGIDPETLRKEMADVGRDETEQPEAPPAPPLPSGSDSSSADTGSDTASPAAVDQPADAADQEGGPAVGATTEEPPSNSLTAQERSDLITMARILVAGIGPRREEIEVIFENCMRPVSNPSALFKQKAEIVFKVARRACHDTADDKRLSKPDAVEKIALALGCEKAAVLP